MSFLFKMVAVIIVTVAASILTYGKLEEVAVPRFGPTSIKAYTLPYVPTNLKVWGEWTDKIYDRPEFLTGGAAGLALPYGKPYTLEEFKRETGERRVYLVPTHLHPGTGTHEGEAIDLTYSSVLTDGTAASFSRQLPDIPAGTPFGHYQMVATEETHPVQQGDKLLLPFVYLKDELSIVFWALVATIVAFALILILLNFQRFIDWVTNSNY